MLITLLFLLLTFFILTQAETSLHYAFYGFTLWYSKVIPSLLPFMILTGILVRMNLTENFANLLHPLIKRLYGCSKNVSYAIIIGFLCGFPMGAKVTAELLKSNKISENEGHFLLCFCNNIGPVYFCSFVVPLLHLSNPVPYLWGMYGIPLIYGFVLRHTLYKHTFLSNATANNITPKPLGLLSSINNSIEASIQSILILCGYMMLFNLINIIPHFLLPDIHKFTAPFLEITGGLSLLKGSYIPFCMTLLTFGGLSCIAQTYSMICETTISIKHYITHKCILTFISAIYFYLLDFII